MDEVTRLKAQYARQVEDGRKIEVFTNTPEWVWYVDHVIRPTIEENIQKIIDGKVSDEKEDWIIRGIIQGLNLVITTPESFQATAKEAKKKALSLGVGDE